MIFYREYSKNYPHKIKLLRRVKFSHARSGHGIKRRATEKEILNETARGNIVEFPQ